MNTESAEDLVGRLYGLLILVEDRMGSERAREAHHFIEVDEYALALEEIAGVLGLCAWPSRTRSATTCWPWPAG
jgi:hypothetical protein